MDGVHELVLVDEVLEDVAQFNADVLRLVYRGLEIEVFDVESEKLAPLREMMLLRRSLTRSIEAVLVPTSPGKVMFWPTMVMQVRLGSTFLG